MANRRNAIKKIRADAQKQLQNRSVRSELRTLTRDFLTSLSEKKVEAAQKQIPGLFSKFDRAVKKGIIRENTANRRKSRLSQRLNLAKTK